MFNCAEQNANDGGEAGGKHNHSTSLTMPTLVLLYFSLSVYMCRRGNKIPYIAALSSKTYRPTNAHTYISMCEGLYVYVSIRFFLLFRGGFR
jgi:hypothetical protein